MKTPSFSLSKRAARALLAAAVTCGVAAVLAHGDVTPQSVDTSTLPQLGAKWL